MDNLTKKGIKISLKAVVIGWLIDIIGSFITGAVIAFVLLKTLTLAGSTKEHILEIYRSSACLRSIVMTFGIVLTTLAGYWTARIARSAELKHAFIMSIMSLLTSILVLFLRSVPYEYQIAPSLGFFNQISLFLVIPSALLGGYLRIATKRSGLIAFVTKQANVLAAGVKTSSANTKIACSATLIALCSLGLTIWGGYQDRLHKRLSVRPEIQMWFNYNDKAGAGWLNSNVGFGPARVKWFKVAVDGQTKKNWQDVASSLIPSEAKYLFTIPWSNTVLSSGTTPTKLFWVTEEPYASILKRNYKRVTLTICYCSFYDECWRRENTLAGAIESSCNELQSVQFGADDPNFVPK